LRERVIDWKRIVDSCDSVPQGIVFSVECGTMNEAERGIEHLKSIVGEPTSAPV
jgi:hypothetical protein